MFPKENKRKPSPTVSTTELGNTRFLQEPKGPCQKCHCFQVPPPTSSGITLSSLPAAVQDGANGIPWLGASSPPAELVPRGSLPQPPGSCFKPKGTMLILCSDIFLLHNSSVEMDHSWLGQTFKKAATSVAFCPLLPLQMAEKRATP